MPNIQQSLCQEIRRLAKKEIKGATSPLKTQLAALRKNIIALKTALKNCAPKAVKNSDAVLPVTETEDGPKVRVTSKGISSLRNKFGISQAKFGSLVVVTALAVGNWEAGKTHPRHAQELKLAAMRKMGKREIGKLLATDNGASQTSVAAAKKSGKITKSGKARKSTVSRGKRGRPAKKATV